MAASSSISSSTKSFWMDNFGKAQALGDTLLNLDPKESPRVYAVYGQFREAYYQLKSAFLTGKGSYEQYDELKAFHTAIKDRHVVKLPEGTKPNIKEMKASYEQFVAFRSEYKSENEETLYPQLLQAYAALKFQLTASLNADPSKAKSFNQLLTNIKQLLKQCPAPHSHAEATASSEVARDIRQIPTAELASQLLVRGIGEGVIGSMKLAKFGASALTTGGAYLIDRAADFNEWRKTERGQQVVKQIFVSAVALIVVYVFYAYFSSLPSNDEQLLGNANQSNTTNSSSPQ